MAVGRVAIFHYLSTDEWHVGYVESIQENGFTIAEANYHHGLRDERFILFDDKSLRGFWSPDGTTNM